MCRDGGRTRLKIECDIAMEAPCGCICFGGGKVARGAGAAWDFRIVGWGGSLGISHRRAGRAIREAEREAKAVFD